MRTASDRAYFASISTMTELQQAKRRVDFQLDRHEKRLGVKVRSIKRWATVGGVVAFASQRIDTFVALSATARQVFFLVRALVRRFMR